jgi:hypothetical protein
MSTFKLPVLEDVQALLLKSGFDEGDANDLVDVLWKELSKIPREQDGEAARQAASRSLADLITRCQLGADVSTEDFKARSVHNYTIIVGVLSAAIFEALRGGYDLLKEVVENVGGRGPARVADFEVVADPHATMVNMIAVRYGLTDDELQGMLGVSGAEAYVSAIRGGETPIVSRDMRERITLAVDIFQIVEVCFVDKAKLAAYIRAPNYGEKSIIEGLKSSSSMRDLWKLRKFLRFTLLMKVWPVPVGGDLWRQKWL